MTDDQALLPFEVGNDRLVRRQWHDGRWFFSVVDVVGLLTENGEPQRYWHELKRKLREEGFQPYEKVVRLQMRSLDGELRETDAADVQTLLRILQSISGPPAEPVKQWLAKVGAELLGEIAAGVVSARDFAVFQDWGYRGLYNGETARDIAARKGLKRGEKLLDHMGSEELAANIFCITQTEAKIKREGIDNMAEANRTHHEVGQAVREFIVERGGTPPEELPTRAHRTQEVQKREQQRLEAEGHPSLFNASEGK
jgi:DNA-damage-inducible protein D